MPCFGNCKIFRSLLFWLDNVRGFYVCTKFGQSQPCRQAAADRQTEERFATIAAAAAHWETKETGEREREKASGRKNEQGKLCAFCVRALSSSARAQNERKLLAVLCVQSNGSRVFDNALSGLNAPKCSFPQLKSCQVVVVMVCVSIPLC